MREKQTLICNRFLSSLASVYGFRSISKNYLKKEFLMKKITLVSIQVAILYSMLFAYSSLAATPGFDTLVNYDTAWTYVYDGGTRVDVFYDVKCLANGVCVCVGESVDSSTHLDQTIMMKLDASGSVIQKKLFATDNNQHAQSLSIAKNGDFIIGGIRYLGPYVMRTDSLGNLKWATWYYDSVADKSLLQGSGTINCLRETKNGKIICAAGDPYPFNNNQQLTNHAVYFEFDSMGTLKRHREWSNVAGYRIGGFDIEETKGGEYLFSGNQAVFYLDTSSVPEWQANYTFQLTGVGSEVNNINRAKVLRDNTPVVMGQAYEGNCWTNYQKLYYDAWWSPIQYQSGLNVTWDTAGYQGGDDAVYDFTQLNDGNLVFVGIKAYLQGIHTIWVFVTDSTGKKMLWEDQVGISTSGATPLSVCSTPDDGFTVVGASNNNGGDAFAVHFVPKPASAIIFRHAVLPSNSNVENIAISERKVIFSFTGDGNSAARLTIVNATGVTVALLARTSIQCGKNTLVWDCSRVPQGFYLYQLKVDGKTTTGKIIVGSIN
jgi:hypothetical protein